MNEHDNEGGSKQLFFNLGMIDLIIKNDLAAWMPTSFGHALQSSNRLVVVADPDIGMIHDMALYRLSRVKMEETQKTVKNFFNVRLQYEKTLTKGELLAFDQ